MLSITSAAKKPPTKKESPAPSSFPLTSLPDELSLSCLARVSSQDLVALPFVSKRYRSLVPSSEFKKMRSQSGCTEDCLYVCLYNLFDFNDVWYVIRRNKTLKSLVMSPIPPCPSPRRRSSLVVRDWGIYMIGGGLFYEHPTSEVWLLDCRTNTWRSLPSMTVARVEPAVGVVDGKIYVFGGQCTDSSNWGEVFDPKTQTWDTLEPMLDVSELDEYDFLSLVMEDKVCGVSLSKGNVVYYYSPSEGKWEKEIRQDLVKKPSWELLCGRGTKLGKLVYGFDVSSGELFWRESGEREWKRVKGLEARFYGEKSIQQVSNFGLNIVFIWLENNEEIVDIWCCEVSLKREKGEVWGMIEWSGLVGTDNDIRYPDPCVGVLYSASASV